MGSNNTETPTRAGIYVRLSRDRYGAGLAVERQEEACRKLADQLGWNVVGVYTDNDVSASRYSRKRRHDYLRLMEDIKSGALDAVIAWHPDRLHRQTKELDSYIDACELHSTATHFVVAGNYDLSTATGRMIARQIGVQAAYESELKSERGRAARVQHAQMGKHHGGIRCYGYKPDGVTVVPEEAAEIKAAAEAIAAGASLRAVVRDMNARSVPTTTGKAGGGAWTSQQLRQTLISPRIAGWSTHNGKIAGPAEWPAIVDDATWRAVEAILSNPARRTNPGVTGAARWLGSGTYICTCGARRMRASVTGGSRRYTYRCMHSSDKTTAHVTRDAHALDAYVEKAIVIWLARHVNALITHDEDADAAALRMERVALSERKDEAAALFADGVIDAVQLATITKRTDARVAEIDSSLASAGRRSAADGLQQGAGSEAAMTKLWGELSLARKRALLGEIADVYILPTTPTTRGFDPAGVRIDWKVPDS